MGRKHARESTMKLLYQIEMNSDFSYDVIDLFFENNNFNLSEKEYIENSIKIIRNNLKEIDSHIKDNIQGWKLSRLAKVDLCTLRIAIYEIIYRDDIPVSVSINEAIEMVKKYSKEESGKFINGVLGAFVRSKEKNE